MNRVPMHPAPAVVIVRNMDRRVFFGDEGDPDELTPLMARLAALG